MKSNVKPNVKNVIRRRNFNKSIQNVVIKKTSRQETQSFDFIRCQNAISIPNNVLTLCGVGFHFELLHSLFFRFVNMGTSHLLTRP